MTPPALESLPAHAMRLPSLPEVVRHLIHSLEDDRADVETLAHHISSDQAIVARLLASANSAASGLSTRIYTARQAFLVLGANRVANIVLASTLSHQFDSSGTGFDTRALWSHSLGVATCAHFLAEVAGLNTEIAFTGGLLHDVGQLLMNVASPAHYVQAIELHIQSDLPLMDAERQIFGYAHTDAGQVLAKEWRFPNEIAEAIGAHHEPDSVGNELGYLVHASEVLSHALDLGETANNRVPDLSELACAELGLAWPKLAGQFCEIEARYEGLRVALGF